jgi:hypothetical protein
MPSKRVRFSSQRNRAPLTLFATERSVWSRLAGRSALSAKIAPVRSAPVKSAPSRLAPEKSYPDRLSPANRAWDRLQLTNFVPLIDRALRKSDFLDQILPGVQQRDHDCFPQRQAFRPTDSLIPRFSQKFLD